MNANGTANDDIEVKHFVSRRLRTKDEVALTLVQNWVGIGGDI